MKHDKNEIANKPERFHPLISIIIPVYNVVSYLREALDSAIHQTYENLEIIIIDDGSTDGSGEICDEYSDDCRVIIIHQMHQGVSAARNTGLDLARGEYIAFLDPDDAYHLSFIRSMLEVAFRENVGIVICKYYQLQTIKQMDVSEKRIILPSAKPGAYSRKDAIISLFYGQLHIKIWSMLYKRELWEKQRFPTRYDVAEDVITLYSVFDLCNLVYVMDQPLYFYRKRSGSLSAIYTEKTIQDRVRACHYIEHFVESHIPEIFSNEHLKECNRKTLGLLMHEYVHVKNSVFAKELENHFIDLVEQTGIANCDLTVRIGYYMIRFNPRLMKILYQTWFSFRSWIRKAID